MKLNMYVLRHELRESRGMRSVESSLNSDYRLGTLEYPLLLETLDDYHENVVYITSEGQLRELLKLQDGELMASRITRPFYCICVGKPLKPLIENKWCDIIWVDSDIRRSTLHNIVQELFQRFNSWEWKLEQIVGNYGGIADLVDASLDVFKNDIWINDQYGKIIVHRIYKNLRLSQEQLDEIREGDYLPKHMIDDGNKEESSGRNFGDSEPIFYRMQAYSTTTLSCAIHAYNNYQLTLAIHPNYQDVSEKDYILIRVLAHYIELAYSRNYVSREAHDTDPRYSFLAALEDNGVLGYDFIQAMQEIGWDQRKHDLLCLCCDYSFERQVYDSCFIRSHLSTCGRIQQEFVCLAVPYKNCVVVLVNLTKSELGEQDFFKKFETIAENYDLTAGVSSRFSRLQEVPGRYLQARTALEQRRNFIQQDTIIRFEDHLLELAINSINEDIPPEFFCPKELIELIKYDEQHGTELYNTLCVYLDNNCSATQACKELFIVRSSFIYRLGKIQKLLELDLRDAQTRLLLSLSVAIIKYYGLERINR